MNLCTSCNEHKNHKKINFIDILPSKNELIKIKDKLKKNIDSFNKDINMIINIFNEVRNTIDIYYKINEDIINNYFDNVNRNYETIYYLNQFQKNNYIDELNQITKSNSIKDKFNNIFNL